MECWNVGDVRITKIVESETWVPLNSICDMFPKLTPVDVEAMKWMQPDHFFEGKISFGYYSFLIETPDRRIVVDTAVGNSKRRTPPEFNMLNTAFLERFNQVSNPDEVDAVVCTHLHADHVGWNTYLAGEQWVPTFVNATYHFVRAEYDHLKWFARHGGDPVFDAAKVLEDSVQPVVDAGLAAFIEPDAVICPEVSVIPSHGHTPGHVSVLIQSKAERAVITGDLMHIPCQIARPDWSAIFDGDSDDAATARRSFLERFADTTTMVLGSHFGTPTGGQIRRDGSSYRLFPLP